MTDEMDVEIALLRQRLEQAEQQIEVLEKRVSIMDRKVLTGQIALVVFIGMGTFVGWIISVSDKVRSWFH